jgi:sialic acid synthase SpsE
VLAVGAVARGACLVTKPFTDDRARRGPDHAGALDPAGFAELVTAVRELEAALDCRRELAALGAPRGRRAPGRVGAASAARARRRR